MVMTSNFDVPSSFSIFSFIFAFPYIWMPCFETPELFLLHLMPSNIGSRGTKVEKMLTLAPERYTAGFWMVAKVILWYIWNHCIADLIDLHKARAVNFLQKPSKNMSKYYFSKCYIFLSKKFRIEKYWVYIIIQHRRRPQKQWWSSKNTAYWFLKHAD